MAKKTLNPDGMPIPRGSYSQVVISSNYVATEAAGGVPAINTARPGFVADVRAQTRYISKRSRRELRRWGKLTGSRINERVHHRRSLSCRCERGSAGVSGLRFSGEHDGSGRGAGATELLLEVNAVAIVPDSSVKDNN